MALWLIFFRQTNQDIAVTNFALLQKHFVEAVNLAHVEWIREGRPAQISMYFDGSSGPVNTTIKMSEQGWPQPEIFSRHGCEVLWKGLINSPLTTVQDKLTVMSAQRNDTAQVCVYSYSEQVKFEYDLRSGVVTSIEI